MQEHYVLLYEALHRYLSAHRSVVNAEDIFQHSYRRATEPTSRQSDNANNSCRADPDDSNLTLAADVIVTSQPDPTAPASLETNSGNETITKEATNPTQSEIVSTELEPCTNIVSSSASVGPIQSTQVLSSSACSQMRAPATAVTMSQIGPIMTSTPMERNV